MSPLRTSTSPILRTLYRTQFRQTQTTLQPSAFRQMQSSSHVGTVSNKFGSAAKADWGYQWKKVGSVAMMYFPVVGVVMFWPYIVEPIMEVVEARW